MRLLKQHFVAIALCAMVLFAGFAEAAAGTQGTIVIQDPSNTPAVWLASSSAALTETMDLTRLLVGTDDMGVEHSVLLWLPLPSAISTAAIQSATLSLLPAGDHTPAVRAGRVTELWTLQEASWGTMHDAVSFDESSGAGTVGEDGWYTIDVTGIVKTWLSGDIGQYGFYLEGATPGQLSALYSAFNTQPEQCPKLTVVYSEQEDSTRYGRFSFAVQEDGNCLSYALRDTAPIYYGALIADVQAFQQVYDASGEAGALAYFSDNVFAYIADHREALQIIAVRRLDARDSEIDTEKEYRVALRVGFHERNGIEGIQVDEEFDFHLRVQLADGSWAEKFPQDPSRVTPGTNAATEIDRYPWDQSGMWGYEKWSAYYDSEVVYFAVEKATDTFTQHKALDE